MARKEEPVIPQNIEELRKILGVESLEGNLETLLKWSQELEKEHGEGFLEKNRELLLAQWEIIQSM
jgi:hypothetical protein